jgi:uncharacterized protein (DUF1330 family)
MSTYVIAQIQFRDRAAYDRYQAAFMPVFSKFNGKVLAADERPRLMEGASAAEKVVIMAFPSDEEAMRFLQSPEYQEISKDRRAGADTVAHLVRGLGK